MLRTRMAPQLQSRRRASTECRSPHVRESRPLVGIANPDFSYSPSQEGLNSPRHDGRDGLERRPPAGTARRRRAAGRTPRSEVTPSRRESHRSAGSVLGVADTVGHSAGHVPAFREGGRQGTARGPGGRSIESHRQEPAAPSAIRHLICWGYVPRREPSRRLGSSPPRPCGPLCRPEAGVPSRPRHGAIGSTPSRAHPRCRRPVAAAFTATGGRSVSLIRHPVTAISAHASRVTGIPVTRLRLLGVRCATASMRNPG